MQPRNKFQAQIAQYSKALPPITTPQLAWAKKHCFDHLGRRTAKGVITCLECGHSWQSTNGSLAGTLLGDTCPHCGATLQITATRKRVFEQTEYLCIATTYKGFQVLRFIYIEIKRKVGEPADYYHREVVQRWIASDGKHTVLALLRPMCCFRDTWLWSSELELRPDKELYDIMPSAVYPRQRLIPELKRNGFAGDFCKLTPFELFHALLTNNKAETLLKTGQKALLHHFVRSKWRNIEGYWPSIRVAIRNGYTVADGSMWCDYLDLLIRFGRDANSPKYVCPENLVVEHDRCVKKRNEQLERERFQEKRQWALENEARFRELKAKFFGLIFSDGALQIRALESVEEHLEEGTAMHHCVFGCNYHLKPDSLILSATMDGKRIETIEVSLKTLKVMQSRGVCNQNTEYHDRIVNLVHQNSNLIRQRIAS